MSRWTSCCKGRASCPEIKIDAHEVMIRDDFGSVVSMTHEQFLEMASTGTEMLADMFPPVPEEEG